MTTSTDNTDPECSQCLINNKQYQVFDGKCCQKDYTFVKGHQLTSCIPFSGLFENCLEYNVKKECVTCKTGFDLTQGTCCPKGMHIDETATPIVCKWNSGITNCLVYDKAALCSKCDDGYFLVDTNKKCCKVG